MADVAAQQPPQQDAKRYHRWLQDDAVKLQMQEVLGNWDVMQFAPDPMKARALFVGLCFVRHAREFRNALDDEVERLRRQPNWITFTSWWMMMQMSVMGDRAEDYPFSLSDDEFNHYSIKNFGDRFPFIQSYHPPNFYMALAGDILNLAIGALAAKAVEVTVPRFAGVKAFSEAGWAGAAARRGAIALGTASVHRVLPGGALDAYRKNLLFPRYVTESHRRALS